jgi:hypothetical protein
MSSGYQAEKIRLQTSNIIFDGKGKYAFVESTAD